MIPTELLTRWETDETRFRQYGQEATADVIKRCRTELAVWWSAAQLEELTLEQAAAYSRLSYDTIQKKVASGLIPNAGSKNRPRVRRGDLPMAPTSYSVTARGTDLASRIRS